MANKKSSRRKTSRAKPAHDDRLVVDSYKRLAEIFGVQLSTVESWRTAGMPVRARGQYVVEDIRNWVTINGKGRKSSSEKDLGELKDEAVRAAAREKIAKAEKLEQEAEILGRKNRMEQGGLCRRADVDRFITSLVSEARILLERIVVYPYS